MSLCVFQILSSAYILGKLVKDLKVLNILLCAIRPIVISVISYVLAIFVVSLFDNYFLKLVVSALVNFLTILTLVLVSYAQYRKIICNFIVEKICKISK